MAPEVIPKSSPPAVAPFYRLRVARKFLTQDTPLDTRTMLERTSHSGGEAQA